MISLHKSLKLMPPTAPTCVEMKAGGLAYALRRTFESGLRPKLCGVTIKRDVVRDNLVDIYAVEEHDGYVLYPVYERRTSIPAVPA